MKSSCPTSPTPLPPNSTTAPRIVVIADDLTGATELAGAALARGLTAEVQTRFDPATKADVVALDTDTRSRTPEEAARIVGPIARAVFRARPAWVYKKTDSVLRGHVRPEIEAILRASEGALGGALLVPANPSRGRVIRRGEYFIDGVPLDETAFARDPEHPRHSARVAALLGPSHLIYVPDAAVPADLAAHATSVDATTLPAGGVDFFNALLAARGTAASKQPATKHIGTAPPLPTLFVCGSAAAWQQGRDKLCAELDIACLTVPETLWGLTADSSGMTSLVDEAVGCLRTRSAAMIAIGPAKLDPGGISPGALAARLAEVAGRIARTQTSLRLCAEGGATARAVIDRLGWTRLDALREWAPGTVELRPRTGGRQSLVCKVGSYEWPAELLATVTPRVNPFAQPVEQPIEGVLDLHTFRPEDLGELIPEYLEQCRARGLLEVRIIHGKGTGNLRRGVEALLRRLPGVETFAPAGSHHGGAGATIVRLRERGDTPKD